MRRWLADIALELSKSGDSDASDRLFSEATEMAQGRIKMKPKASSLTAIANNLIELGNKEKALELLNIKKYQKSGRPIIFYMKVSRVKGYIRAVAR